MKMNKDEIKLIAIMLLFYIALFVGLSLRYVENRLDSSKQNTNFIYQQF